jgi:integrase
MEFLAMTFVRTSELIGMKWEEVDLEHHRWDIPAARMKMKTSPPSTGFRTSNKIQALTIEIGDSI